MHYLNNCTNIHIEIILISNKVNKIQSFLLLSLFYYFKNLIEILAEVFLAYVRLVVIIINKLLKLKSKF